MNFKDLENGYSVYVFDKNNIEVKEGKIVGKDGPKLDNKALTNDFVVDLMIEMDGQSKTYTFKANSEVGYVDAISICTSREQLLREVSAKRSQEEAMKNQIEQAVEKLDEHRTAIEKCAVMLTDLDPHLREKKANEERMTKIEESMNEMRKLMQGLVTRLK